MKLLLDTCVWGGARGQLEAAGHDVEWSGDWPNDPGDAEILAYAYRQRRVLVTLDKDFGELAVVAGSPHAGIIRLVDVAARRQAIVCDQALRRFGDELSAGAIVTATTTRFRIRPAEPAS